MLLWVGVVKDWAVNSLEHGNAEKEKSQKPKGAKRAAQKEITHNEALVIIDALLHMAVEAALTVAPTATDNDSGKCWIINGTPTGAWANKAGQIACWRGGSWRLVIPHEGMGVWNKSTRRHSRFISGQWTTAPTVPNPTGGTAVDSEARAAIVAILQYFRLIGILAT